MGKYSKLFAILVAFALVLSACGEKAAEPGTDNPPAQQSGGSNETPTPTPEPEPAPKPEEFKPVTLNWFYNGYSGSLLDELKERVETKFPHITLNILTGNINETLASTKVDMVAFSMGGLFTVMDLELSSDLSDLVKSHNFDLSRFAPGVIETAKSYSDKGELLVIPYELNNNVLLYNKTIFDQFGLDFPTDDLTWDDVSELVRSTSRVVDGVQYKGFAYSGLNLIYKNQMGLPFVDPVTNKALINTDPWKKWVEVMAGFHQIENNQLEGREDDHFFVDQIMAMRAGPSPLELLPAAIEKGLEWDAVKLPTFAGVENNNQMNAPFYAIPPNSTNRDDAFRVFAYLVSDEVQGINSGRGRVPIVNTKSVVDAYGKELPILEGTNYANAVFADAVGTPITVTKFDGIARSNLSWGLPSVSTGEQDVNSMLREYEEAINKAIEERLN